MAQLIGRSDVVEFAREANDKYLHWDKLRYYPRPEGLTPVQAWQVVKLSRFSSNALPIWQEDRKFFSYWSPPQHLEWLHIIDQQAGGMLGANSTVGLPDDNERYLINSLMEEAIASSQLEGASTTREVAKKLLRADGRPRDRSQRMIVNNYRAIQEIRELKDERLTIERICHLHRIITDGTLDKPESPGCFRGPSDAIHVVDSVSADILHTPPPAESVSERIAQVCEFANDENKPFVHPAIKAIAIHFAIGYIHPFCDGNGRTARALFYWSMLKHGYWLFEYLPISRIFLQGASKYALAYLYTETDDGDLTYFIHYNLKAIIRAISELHKYLERQEKRLKEVADVLAAYPELNHRQIEVVREAIKRASGMFAIRTHAGKYGVAYATGRKDLQDLEKLGFLRSRLVSNRLIFSPVDNLMGQIHKLRSGGDNQGFSDRSGE